MRNSWKSSIDPFRLILVLFSAALVSCSYKPTDEFYRDLKPVPPKVTFSTLSGSDTVVVKGSGHEMEIFIDAGKTYHCIVEVFIGGLKKYRTKESSGHIGLPVNWIVSESGIYPIHLDIYLNTKSGSIADTLGAEYFFFQKDLVLIYDNSGNYHPHLTFESVSDNLNCTLQVPADGPLIRKISVRKGFTYEGPFYTLDSVTGISPFSFYDDSYVGENAYYMVKTYIGNMEGTFLFPFSEWWTEKSWEKIRPAEITLDNNGMPVIQWQKNNFASNCNGYRIFNHVWGATNDTFEIATINDLNQTTLATSDVAFPGGNEIFVSHIPKIPPPGYNRKMAMEKYSSPAGVSAGLPSFLFDRFFAPVGNDFYTTYGRYHIYKYSAQTLTIIDAIETTGTFRSVSVSPNNKYILASTGIVDFDYLLYDITTGTITLVSSSQVIGSGVLSGIVSVSDIGIASVAGGNKIILYDFVHQQKLSEQSFVQEPWTAISPSGNYFFVNSDKLYLYQFSDGNVTEKWHSNGGTSGYLYYSFLPDDDNQAVVIENQVLSIRRCNDWSLVKSFPTDFTTFGNIDFNSRRIFGYNSDYLRIYDFESGKLLRQMHIGISSISALNFRGNTLFYGQSQKLILF
jgi:hypothetical protein